MIEQMKPLPSSTNSTPSAIPSAKGCRVKLKGRQKQYAYYRDLLLNFPKPETA